MKQVQIKSVIVDDEELARLLLKESLKEIPQIEIIGEAENGFEALKLIQDLQPQLIFLDVQMPKLNGFEMLELIEQRPEVIFITAYDSYAIRAFEENAVDYLLKPFTTKRLELAVKKAEERLNTGDETHKPETLHHKLNENKDQYLDRIVVKTGARIRIIPASEIQYLKAEDDYVMIHIKGEKHLKQQTMKYLEEHLNPKDFVRIHRSYIVRMGFVESIELYEKDSYIVKLKDGNTLSVSKSGYLNLRDRLKF